MEQEWIFHVDHGWLYWVGDFESEAYAYSPEGGWYYFSHRDYPWTWLYSEEIWASLDLIRLDPSLYKPITDPEIVDGKWFVSFHFFPISDACVDNEGNEYPCPPQPSEIAFDPMEENNDRAFVSVFLDDTAEGYYWGFEDGVLYLDEAHLNENQVVWNPWARLLWWGGHVNAKFRYRD